MHVTLCDLIHFDWILGQFWSKIVFWLLLWKSDSYFIQTWHRDNNYWLTYACHFMWFDTFWLNFGSFLVKNSILIFTVKIWQLFHSNLAQRQQLLTYLCMSLYVIWYILTEFWVIFGQKQYFDLYCENLTAFSFKLGTETAISDLHMRVTLLCDLIHFDWILCHFWSNIVFWLLLWKSDSYFIQTWHRDNY